MQISLHSRIRSSSPRTSGLKITSGFTQPNTSAGFTNPKYSAGFTNPKYSAGFTLVELLISVGIISIVSAIVLVKYSSFDSTVILKGQAYEIALGLREAQIKSVSVVRNGVGFDYPYGMSFSPGAPTADLPDSKKYFAFLFSNSSPSVRPYYDVAEDAPDFATKLQEFPIPRNMYVSDICIKIANTGNTWTCSSTGGTIKRLDIAFRRPEYKALFYAESSDGGSFSNSIIGAKIRIQSPNGTNVYVVKTGLFGDITVCKEGVASC